MSDLSRLLSIIVSQTEYLIRVTDNQFPALNDPTDETANEIRLGEGVVKASNLIVSAAGQLIATVRSPATSVLTASLAWALPACLKVVNETNVTEILREAGPEGLHVEVIAAKCGVEVRKLRQILRYLARNHIFRETRTDIFCNNSLSSILDTRKSSESIFKNPSEKHEQTNGISALVGFLAGRDFMAAGHLYDHLVVDPATGYSDEPDNTVFKRFCGLTLFEYLNKPENELERKNFGIGMAGVNAIQVTSTVLESFSWHSLKEGSLVIDVGGGVGSVVLDIAKQHQHLRFIVQDLPQVVESGREWFRERYPTAIGSRRVIFEEHDFFLEQPPRQQKPSVYIMRMIAHNWNDAYFSRILINLKKGALSDTALLLIDTILLESSREGGTYSDIKGSEFPLPPEPLLANLGQAKEITHSTDILMLSNLNAQERTLGEFQRLFTSCGWRIKRLYRPDPYGPRYPVAIAYPLQ